MSRRVAPVAREMIGATTPRPSVPVEPATGVDAVPGVEIIGAGASASLSRTVGPPTPRADTIESRDGPSSTVALATALERARAGLATLDGSAILDALDAVWSVAHAPPSAWYLRAAALALLAHPVEAEGIARLGLDQWPDDLALAYAHVLTLAARGASGELASPIATLRAQWPDGPWDAIEAVMHARVPADRATRPTADEPFAHDAIGGSAIASLARALRDEPPDALAQRAMAMARATSWGGEGSALRHAQRQLVAAIFAQLSREGGETARAEPANALERAVTLLREGHVAQAHEVAGEMPEGASRALVAALVGAAEHSEDARASEPGGALLPREARGDGASLPHAPPSLAALWREGVYLLDPPAVDARRIAGLRDRSRRAEHGRPLEAPTGWTMLPGAPRERSRWPMARWGVIVGVCAVLVSLSRCVVQ
ncbi:MAG: hypothetical protein MUF00_06620 [Gemmatimonadaceae bacterium]|nr:hypothetical protein [Gemmatimonadaceae bacterium]